MDLKIGIVTPWGRWIRCGIRTYSENLINALVEKGVEVYVIRLPRFGRKTSELLQLVIDRIPKNDIDILHIQHEYGLYQELDVFFYRSLEQLKIPIVTTMHAVGDWEKDSVIFRVSSKVIVHNEFCRKKFGFPCVVIPHGCKPSKCNNPVESKRSLGIDPRIPIVGYCGFITKYKGIETLITAVSKVKNAGLLIAGGYHIGRETDYIVELKNTSFRMLPGRVQWLGYVPDEKLPTVYGAMDVVVYPSRYATESGALLMAISHGKPVIASDIPPFREKDCLITFSSLDDLVGKIVELLKNKELREELSKKAYEYALRNSWSNVAGKHIKLYEEVLSGG